MKPGRLWFGSVRAVSQKSFGSTVSVHVSVFFSQCRFRRFVPCQEIPSGSAVSVQAVQRFSRFSGSAGLAVQPVQASLMGPGEGGAECTSLSLPGRREGEDFVETDQKHFPEGGSAGSPVQPVHRFSRFSGSGPVQPCQRFNRFSGSAGSEIHRFRRFSGSPVQAVQRFSWRAVSAVQRFRRFAKYTGSGGAVQPVRVKPEPPCNILDSLPTLTSTVIRCCMCEQNTHVTPFASTLPLARRWSRSVQ